MQSTIYIDICRTFLGMNESDPFYITDVEYVHNYVNENISYGTNVINKEILLIVKYLLRNMKTIQKSTNTENGVVNEYIMTTSYNNQEKYCLKVKENEINMTCLEDNPKEYRDFVINKSDNQIMFSHFLKNKNNVIFLDCSYRFDSILKKNDFRYDDLSVSLKGYDEKSLEIIHNCNMELMNKRTLISTFTSDISKMGIEPDLERTFAIKSNIIASEQGKIEGLEIIVKNINCSCKSMYGRIINHIYDSNYWDILEGNKPFFYISFDK